jgi:hypothetical protein
MQNLLYTINKMSISNLVNLITPSKIKYVDHYQIDIMTFYNFQYPMNMIRHDVV